MPSAERRPPLPVAMPDHVGQKIQTITELFAKVERRAGRHQHAIEWVTDFVGRPVAAYVLASVVAAWILTNVLAPRFGWRPLDPPPFESLQCVMCVGSLLMALAILTTQNRAAKLAQQRTQLDLQVNLIAEEKIAKIVALLEELRRDIPTVRDRRDSLAEAMTEAVDLHAVADELESFKGDAGDSVAEGGASGDVSSELTWRKRNGNP
jgi:uncharacterized membrane protein